MLNRYMNRCLHVSGSRSSYTHIIIAHLIELHNAAKGGKRLKANIDVNTGFEGGCFRDL